MGIEVALVSGETLKLQDFPAGATVATLCALLEKERAPAIGKAYRIVDGTAMLEQDDEVTKNSYTAVLVDDLVSGLVGQWEQISGDGYFVGLQIFAGGAYVCNRGRVQDGLVRVVSERQINLKRT